MTQQDLKDTLAYIEKIAERDADVFVEELSAREYWQKYPNHSGLKENGLIALMNTDMEEGMRAGRFLGSDPLVQIRKKCKFRETPEFLKIFSPVAG